MQMLHLLFPIVSECVTASHGCAEQPTFIYKQYNFDSIILRFILACFGNIFVQNVQEADINVLKGYAFNASQQYGDKQNKKFIVCCCAQVCCLCQHCSCSWFFAGTKTDCMQGRRHYREFNSNAGTIVTL